MKGRYPRGEQAPIPGSRDRPPPLSWMLLFLILLLLTVQAQAQSREPYQLPTYPSRRRYEDDAFEKVTAMLEAHDRFHLRNWLNADPTVGRTVLVRLLRDPSNDERARVVAQTLESVSTSAVDRALVDFVTRNTSAARRSVLDAFEQMDQLRIAVRREGFNDRIHTAIARHAPSMADAIIDALDRLGFEQGVAEALYFKANAIEFFTDEDLPINLEKAIRIFRKYGNLRGQFNCYWREASYFWFSPHREKAEQLFDEYIRLLDTSEDPLLQIYLHYTLEGERAHPEEKWPLLKALPGLPVEKVRLLLRMSGEEHSYLPEVEAIIDAVEDPVILTRLEWMVYQHDYLRDDPLSVEWGYRAVDGAESLGYDISAFPFLGLSRQTPPLPAAPMMLWQLSGALGARADIPSSLAAKDRALHDLDASADLWTEDQIRVMRSVLLSDEGDDLRKLGDYSRALDTSEQGLQLLESTGEWHFSKLACRSIASTYTDLGDFRSAEAVLERALAIPDPVYNFAPVLLGELNLNFHRYDEALRWLERAKEDLDQIERGKWWRDYRTELLTRLWMELGQWDKALDSATELEKTSRAAMIAQSPRGELLIAEGDLEAAEGIYRRRLEETRGKSLKGKEADALKNLGRIDCRRRRFETGLDYLDRALALSRALGNLQEEQRTLNELALCQMDAGNRTGAASTFDDAVRVAETLVDYPGIWTARFYLGQIAEEERNPSLALEQYRAAADAVEAVAAHIRVDTYKASFLEDKTKIYDRLIRLLGPTQPEEAFYFSEKRRAQAYLDSVRARGLPIAAADPRLNEERARSRQRLIGTQVALRNELTRPPEKRDEGLIARLQQQLIEARRDHADVIRRVQLQRGTETYKAGWTTPVRVESVQSRVLHDGEALIEYVVADHDVFAFVVTSKRVRFYTLPSDRTQVTEDVASLLTPFRQLKEGRVDLLHLDFDVELAYRLYQRIFEPLEPALNGLDELLIVPDDALHYLPFESLPRSPKKGAVNRRVRYEEYANVDWLLQHYTIRYAVSASSLEASPVQTAESNDRLVAFAEPLPGGENVLRQKAVLRGASAPDALAGAFIPIPEAHREVLSVSRRMSAGTRVLVLEGEKANERAFFENAPDADYLHFAVHSFVDDRFPDFSSLVLSPDTNDDGLLQSFEIMQTHLHSRLVTLSACETGLGRLFRGEGVLGLKRAFLVAGARSVLLSLWSIEDSTADFMDDFYGRLAAGTGPAEAVRATKLDYLKRRRPLGGGRSLSLSHPFFWAPLTLTVSTTN